MKDHLIDKLVSCNTLEHSILVVEQVNCKEQGTVLVNQLFPIVLILK